MSIFTKAKNKFNKLFVHKDGEEEPDLQETKESESKDWRTRRYRRFFEGYTEVMEPKPGGGYRTNMVYTSAYYRAKMSARSWRMLKVFYVLLSLLSVAVWFPFAFQHSMANTLIYVYVPEVLCLCAYLMLLRYLIERAFAPHKLIIREYKDAVKNIRLISTVLMILLAVSAAMVLLHMLIAWFRSGYFDLSELWQVLAFLAAAACIFIIYFSEKRIEYETLPNENANVKGYTVK